MEREWQQKPWNSFRNFARPPGLFFQIKEETCLLIQSKNRFLSLHLCYKNDIFAKPLRHNGFANTSRLEGATLMSLPYGFMSASDGCIIVEPEKANIVQTIYQRYLSGMSLGHEGSSFLNLQIGILDLKCFSAYMWIR